MKQQIRQEAKNLLRSIAQEDKEQLDTNLSRNLFGLLLQISLQKNEKLVIGAFDPIQQEPHWFKSFGETSDYSFAFPGNLRDSQMSFYTKEQWSLEKLEIGIGLKDLSETLEIVPDVLIIPGLSFSKTGERLGRGKGFYDRYLDGFSGLKIGVCYECQLREDIPTEEHDQKLDWVITELNIYRKEAIK